MKKDSKKVRKNILFPADNIQRFAAKADRMGMDVNGLLNFMVSAVVAAEEARGIESSLDKVRKADLEGK